MLNDEIKVYTYTRVSTIMQIDGYSLDAQKSRIKAYAEFNGYKIVGEYEDAGKSGKSVEGRPAFRQMISDIKTCKDDVSYVLVFKLSRFGRNAADVLSTLQIMEDFGVHLICIEDGVNSSKESGKLMISILSAVAEIERENIRIQSMEGRIQKAKEGRWNGGRAPYGYKLINGQLFIDEERAETIRLIFDKYVNTTLGIAGIVKYLENHGIYRKGLNSEQTLFTPIALRRTIDNPVYMGKIAYGRRKLEKIKGTRNGYHVTNQEEYMLTDGMHKAIIPSELWDKAHQKRILTAQRYQRATFPVDQSVHLLSGILKCPICGKGMCANTNKKRKPDGSRYKDFHYYYCKHPSRDIQKCTFKNQLKEETLDSAVQELLFKIVKNPSFIQTIKEKIDGNINTDEVQKEVEVYRKTLKQCYAVKTKILEEINNLDPDGHHYLRKKADLDERLDSIYDKIEDAEKSLEIVNLKRDAINSKCITKDNIQKVLICFDKLFKKATVAEQKRLIGSLIERIDIYPQKQSNGQWLKSITFKVPLTPENFEISWEDESRVETCVLLSQQHIDKHINIKVDIDELNVSRAESKATYQQIQEYILSKYGFKVPSLYISQIKRKYGIIERQCYNTHRSENFRQPNCPKEKEDAIVEALKHFKMI